MLIANIQIILWRIWDAFITLVWNFVPDFLRKILWNIISSKFQINRHIEDCLVTSEGVIIQVGSNDGVSNDPLFEGINKHKRAAYLVEPLDYLAKKLRLLHKDNPFVRVCEYAIHPNLKYVDFYHLPADADAKMGSLWKPWYDQIGSFSKQHLVKHSPNIEPFIEKSSIECRTLNDLISEYSIDTVAIIHIDAEGFDLEVLRSLDLNKVKPKMIMLEHKHLDLYPLLSLVYRMKKMGYHAKVYHDDIVFLYA